MIKLNFIKMHGCGNDYIYFDCFEQTIRDVKFLAQSLCHRNKGIGGDGIVLISPSTIADAKMNMYNKDGSEATMCGNAIRCVAKYVYESGIVKDTKMTIETLSGVKMLYLYVDEEKDVVTHVKVDMGLPIFTPHRIPVLLEGDSIISRPITLGNITYKITCVSMGNPHCVIFGHKLDELLLPFVGPLFEKHKMFPEGVNIEFVEIVGKNHLKIRVWEKGNGETLACGTGACAAAVAAILNGYCDKNEDVRVTLLGGQLTIRYADNTVYMLGECVKTFEGTVEV